MMNDIARHIQKRVGKVAIAGKIRETPQNLSYLILSTCRYLFKKFDPCRYILLETLIEVE